MERYTSWKPLSSPGAEICDPDIIESSVIDGKLYMYRKGVVYNPKDGTCEPVESNMCKGREEFSYCVINNVLFYYHDEGEVFQWYDTKVRKWRNLKGLEEGLPKFPSYSDLELADYGGKMLVFWDLL